MNLMQTLLLLNMFVLGIAVTIAVQHAHAHYMHRKYPEKDHAALKDSPLPKEFKDRLLKQAQESFQDRLDASADSMQHDLKATSDRINMHMEQLGNDVIHKAAERHDAELEQLYAHAEAEIKTVADSLSEHTHQHKQKLDHFSQQTDTAIAAANQDIADYRQQLKDKLDELYHEADASIATVNQDIHDHAQTIKQQASEQAEVQKQQLLQQFEDKLADAVAAFLLETLGHNVDLGAQSEYLTRTLQAHKDELLKGVKDET